LDLACSWRQLSLQGFGSNDVGVTEIQGNDLRALPAQAGGHRPGLLVDLRLSHTAPSPACSELGWATVWAGYRHALMSGQIGDKYALASPLRRSERPVGAEELVPKEGQQVGVHGAKTITAARSSAEPFMSLPEEPGFLG
jgi:hypothetical protein